jgi:hypothetical protein
MHLALLNSSSIITLYVNGVQETTGDFSSTIRSGSSAGIVNIGRYYNSNSGAHYLNGYIHDFYFVEGSAVTPVGNFIEADSTSGVYKPKVYDLSSAGSNSFRLDFEDSSDIGNDVSGNDNDFTPTNLSSHDIVPDIPTNNWSVMSPINSAVNSGSVTFSEGSLGINSNTAANKTASTFAMPSGKWYAEVRVEDETSNAMVGVCRPQDIVNSSQPVGWGGTGHVVYANNGYTYNSSTSASTTGIGGGTAGDIYQLAVDVDNLKIWYGRNGTWEGTVDSSGGHTLDSGTQVFAYSYRDLVRWNFGQNGTFDGEETAGGNSDGTYGDFMYSVPSGYKALCSANLSATIADPSAHFGAIKWTGNGTSNNDAQSITGLGFQPDLVWVKGRGAGTQSHELHDSVRGAGKRVFANDTAAESDVSTLDSFDSDGFTVSVGSSGQNGTNGDGIDYVGWCWKAGTAFDAGGGAGTGSKNASAGFSIVTWSGQDDDMQSGSDTDVSHGLGVKPDLILIKNRTNNADGDAYSDTDWCLWNSGLSGDDYFKRLNTVDDEQQWDSEKEGLKSIGASTFTVANGQYDSGTYFFLNWEDMAAIGSGESDDYVAYCFANSDVFQTGVYSGNSSSDGPVVHTGFKPAMVWLDRISSQSLHIMDTARSPSNVVDDQLYPSSNAAEAEDNLVKIDILSNGFKLRNSQAATNTTGNTYLYYAFAEQNAKYSTTK